MFKPFQAMKRRIRLYSNDFNARIELAQIFGNTCQSTACTQSSNEVGYLTAGLFDDLWFGAEIMRQPIGWIVILVGVEIQIWLFFCHMLGNLAGTVRTL